MLLEFHVKNFKSIRDEQVLSLVASGGDKELAETHLAPTGLKALPNAVRSAAVYGPNASGKSTLLSAIEYMRAVVWESATVVQPGQTYNVQPFKLDTGSLTQPTEFEITFLLHGIRHQYAFAMTAARIVSESLLVYRTGKPTQWYSRQLAEDGERYDYEFSSYLTGPKKLWEDSTRPNALFLSTAAQLNSDLLGPVFQWITGNIVYLAAMASPDPQFTTAMLATAEGRKTVRDFLAAADTSIADVQAVSRKGFRNVAHFRPGGVAHATSEEAEIMLPVFEHIGANGSAKFELQDESDGTKRLFALIAPLMDVLSNGRVLLVDELDGSLHTLLVRQLLSMFHDPKRNASGAQLIFTTHSTTLLDHQIFRRDQIWFTEKDRDLATRVFPLSDFSPRKHEAWERGYLMGRYGAVPFLSDLPEPSPVLPGQQPATSSTTLPTGS